MKDSLSDLGGNNEKVKRIVELSVRRINSRIELFWATVMDKPVLTRNRIILAFAIAVVADAIQFPIVAVEATGVFSIPGELADFLVDCVVMAATTLLLGFHWMLLPTLFVEAIPGLDLLPTWTGCVAYVVWQRKKEHIHRQPVNPVIDVCEVEVVTTPAGERLTQPPPPTSASIPE